MVVRKRKLPTGWYPGTEDGCITDIRSFLTREQNRTSYTPKLGAIIPHAGWGFSGSLSCRTISKLQPLDPEVVVVIGGHLGPGVRPSIYNVDQWETPMGKLEIHRPFVHKIMERIIVAEELDYDTDHTVEIQLPFVKYFFPRAKLVGMRAPMSDESIELGKILYEISRELEVSMVILASSDLTHYGPNFSFSPKGIGKDAVQWVKEVNDKEFIERCLQNQEQRLIDHAVKNRSSCSPGPAAALVRAAREMGISQGSLYDYYTSYEVRPDINLVGYAGILY